MKGSFVRFFPLILDTLYNRTEQLLAKRRTVKHHFTHPKSTRAFYEQRSTIGGAGSSNMAEILDYVVIL